MIHAMKGLACVILLLTIAACGEGEQQSHSRVAELQEKPIADAPYAVGSGTMFIHDNSRSYDSVVGVDDGVRILITEIWYPIDHDTADSGSYRRATYGDYVFGDRKMHRLMMTNGDAGSRYNMQTVCEYLAAHGYVVIAPEHTGNSPYSLTGRDPALGPGGDPELREKMSGVMPLFSELGAYGSEETYGQSYTPLPADLLASAAVESVLLAADGPFPLTDISKPTVLLSGAEDGLIIGLAAQQASAGGTAAPTPGNPHTILRRAFEDTDAPVIWGLLADSNHSTFGVSGGYWWPELKPNTQARYFEPETEFELIAPKIAHQMQSELALESRNF